jgi:SAM-dependent methyltransferase
VQIHRAAELVPSARFIWADMTELALPQNSFDAIISLYAIIHVPLERQAGLFRKIADWLKPGGWFLGIVGHHEWTGTEDDWLGVQGATMFWSHADQETYETWLMDLHFRIAESFFIPEGNGGHAALLAQRSCIER